MLRGLRYIVLIGVLVWVVLNLFTRERRKNISEGFQRAGIVISLMFVAAGIYMLYQALSSPSGGIPQAITIIAIGIGMVVYQRSGQ